MSNFKSSTFFACICVLLLLVGSIVLSACGTTSTVTSTVTSTATVEPPPAEIPTTVLIGPHTDLIPETDMTPQYGGHLVVINDNSVSNLGAPWKSMGGHERGWNRFGVENLIGLDNTGTPVPQLATSWDLDMDEPSITMYLREGVYFHDGTPFNAEAAKWCLDMNRTEGLVYLANVTSVDAVDEYTIKLNLGYWDPTLLKNLSGSQAGDMVSPTAAQANGDEAQRYPVGTGPFKMASYIPLLTVTWERNEDYWQEGLPFLDSITVTTVSDKAVGVTSFKKGEAQFIQGLSTEDAVELRDLGYILHANTSTVSGWAPDSANPDSPLADVRVRQAFAYGINNAVNCDAVHLGMRPAITQVAIEGQGGYDPTIKGYPYDPAKAAELLDEAGYGPNGEELNLKYYYNGNPTTADYLLLCMGDMAELNVNMELVVNDNATDHALMANGWEDGFTNFRMDYNAIEVEYSAGLTNKLSDDAQDYVSMDKPDEFDAIYEQILEESDFTVRRELYKEINKLATDELCIFIPGWEQWNYPARDGSKLHDYWMSHRAVWEFLPEIAWMSD